jgi:hypothetical protein
VKPHNVSHWPSHLISVLRFSYLPFACCSYSVAVTQSDRDIMFYQSIRNLIFVLVSLITQKPCSKPPFSSDCNDLTHVKDQRIARQAKTHQESDATLELVKRPPEGGSAQSESRTLTLLTYACDGRGLTNGSRTKTVLSELHLHRSYG